MSKPTMKTLDDRVYFEAVLASHILAERDIRKRKGDASYKNDSSHLIRSLRETRAKL